jgi:pimeloyl-ACP methyl ester carboxylesterase
MGVYFNWWLLDPFFTIRMIFHGWHPNSPLSHPLLTKRVFFGDQVSSAYVEKFQGHMNAYESFWWPLGMMKPFVNSHRLLSHIAGWGRGPRILILYGQQDKLMTRPVMRRLAESYRAASRHLADKEAPPAGSDAVKPLPGTDGQDDEGQGVRFCVVPGAGHHMQNDTTWEVGAEKLLRFYEQL